MPILEELFDSIGNSNIFTIVDLRQGFKSNCAYCEGLQKNGIPWKQQVMGIACDAFWIKECICLFLMNHGPGFRRGRFLEVLHR